MMEARLVRQMLLLPLNANDAGLCKVTSALPKDLSLDFQTLKTNHTVLSAQQCQ